MPEQTHKVETYRIEYICDECRVGVMEQTGLMKPSIPPFVEHRCPICEATQWFRNKCYPITTYEYIDEGEDDTE